MAFEDTGTILPCKAGGTISAMTFVKIVTSDLNVTVTAAKTDVGILGVAKNDAVSGGAVGVQTNGVAKVLAGGALATVGVQLTVDSAGRVVAADATSKQVGILLETAAGANSVVAVCLDAKNPIMA